MSCRKKRATYNFAWVGLAGFHILYMDLENKYPRQERSMYSPRTCDTWQLSLLFDCIFFVHERLCSADDLYTS